jgi:hypothetical protein
VQQCEKQAKLQSRTTSKTKGSGHLIFKVSGAIFGPRGTRVRGAFVLPFVLPWYRSQETSPTRPGATSKRMTRCPGNQGGDFTGVRAATGSGLLRGRDFTGVRAAAMVQVFTRVREATGSEQPGSGYLQGSGQLRGPGS